MSNDEILNNNEKQLLGAMGLLEEATPEYIAHAGKKLESNVVRATQADIVKALQTVSDPEIMINIYDMGLVYRINQLEDGDVEIDMTVTAPTCPVAGILPQEAADAVAQVDGVGEVEVKIVWEPAWTIERMSDDAKAMIELF